MAKLDARMDDFIGLVLDVSGRARPSDIQGVDQNEAAELLRQYRSEHPDRRLVFSGDTLIPESGAPSAAPSPAPAYGAAAPQSPASGFDQWPATAHAPEPAYPGSPGGHTPPASQPAAAEYGFGDSNYGMPSPGGQVPSAGAEYGTPAAYGSPQSAPVASFDATPGAASFQPTATDAQSQYAAQPPYVEQVPPAGDWQGSADPFVNEPAAEAPSEPRAAWYWWLLPVLFSWLGGLIAWLALRDRQPRAAKRLLVLGLVMTVVMIALSALLMALGLAAFLTPVTTTTTVGTSLTTVTPTP